MDCVSLVAICVSAIAMVIVAWYAIKSHKLAVELKSRDVEYRQHVTDLYQALIICNLASIDPETTGTKGMGGKIDFFKKHYKGETPIFE